MASGPWPMPLGPDAELRLSDHAHAEAMYALIERDREAIGRWVRTPATAQDLEDARIMITRHHEIMAEGPSVVAGVFWGDRYAGEIMLSVDRRENAGSIGYWLGAEFQGHGLMTRAVKAILAHAFEGLGLHRVEICCGEDNLKSRAIPERLGFTLEGVRREAQRFKDRYVSLVVYGMLATEWRC
jgi:ribosomal-protein-serine acetyltransferase